MIPTGANRLMGGCEGRFDGHAHVFRRDLPLAPHRRYTPQADAPLEDYVGLLRKCGLDGGILVQPSFLGSDNSFLFDALRHAARVQDMTFRGVVVFDPSNEVWHADLETAKQIGIIGMRLNLVGVPDHALDLGPWREILEAVSRRDWHVELHCEGSRLSGLVEQLLAREVTVVVDHFGLPCAGSYRDCPGHRAILAAPPGRVFVKASAPYRVFPGLASSEAAHRCWPIYQDLLNALGPEHLLWGSDWPWTRFENRHAFAEVWGWQSAWSASPATGRN